VIFLIDIAYAMGGDAIIGGAKGMGAFIPLILMFVIFYFLLIRPQQKRAKEHREVLKNLRKGDTVVTSGGIHGRITGLTDTIVTLEIADKVRIKVSRGQIAGLGKVNDKE
jgi:preprotein translocase subunit YajC